MLFVFNENESNNYQLNEIWPTKLCIKNVIETGPLSPMSNLVGDCAEWEIKEIRDQGSHPLSHLPSCPAGSNINDFLIHPHFSSLAPQDLGQSPQICTVSIFANIFLIFLFSFHFTWIYVAFGLHMMKKIVVKLKNFFYPFWANFRISDVRPWDLRFSQIYMI